VVQVHSAANPIALSHRCQVTIRRIADAVAHFYSEPG